MVFEAGAKCVIAQLAPDSLDETARAAKALGLQVAGACLRAGEAYRLTRLNLPRALILHALLPGLGNAYARLDAMGLYAYPAVIYALPDAMRNGAPDCVSPKPTPAELYSALTRALPLPAREDVIVRADELLKAMSIPEGIAREYLAHAVALVVNDAGDAKRLCTHVYPRIARARQTTPRRVEDAMRRAIERAWTTGDIEDQYAYFGNTISAQRGKPTCAEMIATAADILRLRAMRKA